ncbi:acyl-CoA N-acyltransferase [Zopfia rhizophila CBS 207.26]|uniref:Acyl-CoA N-acyltransferase n=1 Tax=Zopfia rhizophila CBS 207.26 TaxID=1314779 RepID=A0A6A6EX33_9PEZI|nr:acyl-CoA N-acyltransferase [Zopfia rhizophila CBS 207.26]
MPSPNLTLSPLTPDEAHLYTAVRHESFRPLINKIIYTREPSKETLDKVTESIRKGIADGIYFMKVKDEETGEMLAGARWRFIGPKEEVCVNGAEKGVIWERTWEEVDKELTIPEPYEESDPRIWKAFCELFNQSKRENMGRRPYYVLDTLVTHPSHHRRGAGGMLIQWGCDQADTKGVEAYVEASQMGVPLYERYGFRRIKDIELDLGDFGGGEKFVFTIMIRPAKGSSNS